MPFSKVSHPRGQGRSWSILWFTLETHTITCAVFSWSPWFSLSWCRKDHTRCEHQSDGTLGPSSRLATMVSTVTLTHRWGKDSESWDSRAGGRARSLQTECSAVWLPGSCSSPPAIKRGFMVYFDACTRIFRYAFKVRKFLGAPSWKEILGV